MNAAADGFRRLRQIARRAMLERGLAPDFPEAALRELHSIQSPTTGDGALDLRDLAWCSIDNDDSRDLDQLTVAEELAGGETKVLVAVADVDALVAAGTAISGMAEQLRLQWRVSQAMKALRHEQGALDLRTLEPRAVRIQD